MLCAIHKVDKNLQDKRGKYYHWVTGTKIMCYDNQESTGYNVETKETVSFDKPSPALETEAHDKWKSKGKELFHGEQKPDAPMTKRDWNFKAFTEGLRALTFEYRKEDMSPSQVWSTTHTKQWMEALYGDDEGYIAWEEGLEERLLSIDR